MKTTKKWSKILLAGMAVMMLTFGLAIVGCDTSGGSDDNGGNTGGSGGSGGTGGGNVTISFAPSGTNAFTITLSEGEWTNNVTDAGFKLFMRFLYQFSDFTGYFTNVNEAITYSNQTYERQTDPRIMKVTFSYDGFMLHTGSFKISMVNVFTYGEKIQMGSYSNLSSSQRNSLTIGTITPVTINITSGS